jgi:putative glutathione S-transferase
VTADGSSGYPAEAGRYHLYVCFACPWAHRTIIVRRLMGLEGVIGMSAVNPIRDSRGWRFTGGEYTDAANGFGFLSEAYIATDPTYDGRATTPTLWDTRTGRIVSNESGDVMRMLSTAFAGPAEHPVELAPEALRGEMDAFADEIYAGLNNAVYRAGFASTQEAYEEPARAVFATLDRLEERLAGQRYAFGDAITEVDWRIFTTLVRFDAVYHGHFKCSLRRLVDYPVLWAYTRDLYQQPGIAETVRMDEIKRHYYGTHPHVNPTGVVPIGPALDFTAPHGRESLSATRDTRPGWAPAPARGPRARASAAPGPATPGTTTRGRRGGRARRAPRRGGRRGRRAGSRSRGRRPSS